jgi:hypothetical protein
MSCDEKMRMIEKALDATDLDRREVDSPDPEKVREFSRRKGYVKRGPSSD